MVRCDKETFIFFFFYLLFFTKLLDHLRHDIGPDAEVLLVVDGGDPGLGPALVLLQGDGAGEVRPVLED